MKLGVSFRETQSFLRRNFYGADNHPTLDDMIAVGVKNKMTENKCREIYEEVKCMM